MLCCHCQKNQATKTYERIVEGRNKKEYYCLDCYDRLFLTAGSGKLSDGVGKMPAVCPVCGTSEEDFRTTGLVGCARCYEALAASVIPAVIRLQGTEAHRGERPGSSALAREELITRRNLLKKQIEESLKSGNFEGARSESEELKRINGMLYEGDD